MSNPSSFKTAIVTGSSRGIGKAIAIRLAAAGFAVTVNYASKVNEAVQVVADIQKAGGRAIALQADVSDVLAATKLFDQTEKEFGGVDVLVNTAGVIAIKTMADTEDADFDRLMAINVKGTFNVTVRPIHL